MRLSLHQADLEVAVIRAFCHTHSDLIDCPGQQTLLLSAADVPYQRVCLPRACMDIMMLLADANVHKLSNGSMSSPIFQLCPACMPCSVLHGSPRPNNVRLACQANLKQGTSLMWST